MLFRKTSLHGYDNRFSTSTWTFVIYFTYAFSDKFYEMMRINCYQYQSKRKMMKVKQKDRNNQMAKTI